MIRLGRSTSAVTGFALLAFDALALGAQSFEGRVLDIEDYTPVPTALVRLVDQDGDPRSLSIADSTGRYRIEAPGPGVYRLQAERIGYDGMETPLLEAGSADGVYSIDLVMRRAPLPIEGLRVSTEQVDRQLRLIIGLSLPSLRTQPLRVAEIRSHIERGHDLTGLLRWTNIAGLVIHRTDEGPCYSLRGRGCLPVYFNGFRLSREILGVVPLEMIHTIVVLHGNESITYPGGAVLLYSEAWLR